MNVCHFSYTWNWWHFCMCKRPPAGSLEIFSKFEVSVYNEHWVNNLRATVLRCFFVAFNELNLQQVCDVIFTVVDCCTQICVLMFASVQQLCVLVFTSVQQVCVLVFTSVQQVCVLVFTSVQQLCVLVFTSVLTVEVCTLKLLPLICDVLGNCFIVSACHN